MLYKLIVSMDSSRFETTVISLTDEGSLGPGLKKQGITVHCLQMPRGLPAPRSLRRLRQIVNTLRPDILQGWMYHGNLAAFVSGSRAPILWNVRQSLYEMSRERWLTQLVIYISEHISSRVTTILYNSRVSAQQHAALGFSTSNAVVIPNGFDISVFRPDSSAFDRVRAELNVTGEQILIGLVARYHPMKDHAGFLRAAALLSRDHPEARFVMAGLGVDKNNRDLMSLIHRLGLSPCVILLGERDNISSLMPALDIASCSSAWGEGFPNVIGEAMACGVPCVVTDVGDCASIVGETGRVVPPRDPSSLAQAWRELIDMGAQQRQQLGLAARERVKDNFSLDAVTRRYEALYQNVYDQVRH